LTYDEHRYRIHGRQSAGPHHRDATGCAIDLLIGSLCFLIGFLFGASLKQIYPLARAVKERTMGKYRMVNYDPDADWEE
jgi:hypothetical protein